MCWIFLLYKMLWLYLYCISVNITSWPSQLIDIQISFIEQFCHQYINIIFCLVNLHTFFLNRSCDKGCWSNFYIKLMLTKNLKFHQKISLSFWQLNLHPASHSFSRNITVNIRSNIWKLFWCILALTNVFCSKGPIFQQ